MLVEEGSEYSNMKIRGSKFFLADLGTPRVGGWEKWEVVLKRGGVAGLFLGDIQGCQIGRAVLGRPLSVLLGRFGHPPFWGVKKGEGVKKEGGAYFFGDINYYIN